MEAPTRAELDRFTAVLTAGSGAVQGLPPQLKYAVAGVSAYLTAAETGSPATEQLRDNALALWEILRAAAETPVGTVT
ncbi:hypothetical protein [Kitasatospora cineracea]|uniref:Uncharacterized protein n=1 Tax=Kitasatospora cineracea TaxID=88074 RepID=A0A3N4RUV4_9ACTN|nr:hypothetical protein [Kitasatospora cineracea]RPE36686.1 hypothetical protein EDD38_5063 [Kitasatospora cineracea]